MLWLIVQRNLKRSSGLSNDWKCLNLSKGLRRFLQIVALPLKTFSSSQSQLCLQNQWWNCLTTMRASICSSSSCRNCTTNPTMSKHECFSIQRLWMRLSAKTKCAAFLTATELISLVFFNLRSVPSTNAKLLSCYQKFLTWHGTRISRFTKKFLQGCSQFSCRSATWDLCSTALQVWSTLLRSSMCT